MWYLIFNCLTLSPLCMLSENLTIETHAETRTECMLVGELTLVTLENQGKASRELLKYHCEYRSVEG